MTLNSKRFEVEKLGYFSISIIGIPFHFYPSTFSRRRHGNGRLELLLCELQPVMVHFCEFIWLWLLTEGPVDVEYTMT